MTLALVWRNEAVTDLLDIFDYIAERNITAADRLLAMIEHMTEHLPDHPYIHRPGRVSGTREAIVHPNYILVYRVAADVVEILAVLHARQQYP
ncbi:toxin ParE1/3/4 [Sphingomonas sp. SORGH_AS802]|uniref:type II toxin-antitoxin system RelE/ParE family toxin n=1 Tax=unclassified Sphingomonas TaxID=196159 RepID=UPI002854458D|nr:MULTISPECIES: type II toxin-antitoxin system RelE/ParE family toxin [unclassified Sphingomonas]MDR6127608.1 toxin ParE1/3/4 [Sphingomonas sp. SORGH_AS_0438]MDR6133480.1 toxin ParE1/3/4 [Sphingomonas sp. SORGH_AS_0802]